MDYSFPTKHEIIAAIRAAFDGVDRGDGVTLHEADVIDSHGSDDERATARLLDTDQIWEQVPPQDVETCSTALSFLDRTGFRYYLPVYMIWTLDNEPTGHYSAHSTLFHLETLHERDARAVRRLELLNDTQRRAIALFLLYFTPALYIGDDARDALHRFWGQYLPEKYRHDAGAAAG